MNTNPEEVLASVAAQTLEELAFLFAMHEGEEPAEGDSRGARVTFNGPKCGVFAISASAGVLDALAENMLGLDDDDEGASPEQQEDALRELANIVCGNLLPEVYGRESVFLLDAPDLLDNGEAAEAPPDTEQVAATRLYLDEGVVDVALYIGGEAES